MRKKTESPDGKLRENAANILAENMLSQVDHEGLNILLMIGIGMSHGGSN
jgi:hypothetical protein